MGTDLPARALVVKAIVAMDEGRVIGVNNGLPWHLPEDLRRFSVLTKGHAVLMGRKTYDSLPPKFKPLPGRLNIVISRSLPPTNLPLTQGGTSSASMAEDTRTNPYVVFAAPQDAIQACKRGDLRLPTDTLWVVGGEEIYRATLGDVHELFVTRVDGRHEGDAFFPPFETGFKLEEVEPREGYSFERYRKI